MKRCFMTTNSFVAEVTFRRQPHKMIKHTKTIRRQFADKLFKYVWPFSWVGTYS